MWDQILTARLSELNSSHEFSGVVWIQQGANTVFSGAYGYAQRAWQIPNQVNTRFRLGSMTKMFTATAVLQLISRAELDWDTLITPVLDLRETTIPASVNVRHLLTMTSGIADWFDEEAVDWMEQWENLRRSHPLYLLRDNRDYIPLFSKLPPVAEPGVRYAYNGAGFILLGMLVEQVSGQPFQRYLEKHIFQPAGMDGAGFPALDEVQPDLAEGYTQVTDQAGEFNSWRTNIYQVTPCGAADGGSVGRAADLKAFSEALRKCQLLNPEFTNTMLTPQVRQLEEPVRGYQWMYGFGLIFLVDMQGIVVRWGHTGEEDGVSCRFYHYPAMDLDVIILGNQSQCAGSLGWEIHDLLLAPR